MHKQISLMQIHPSMKLNEYFQQTENEQQLNKSQNNFQKLEGSGSGFFVTSNPLSNRNETNSTKAKNTTDHKSNEDLFHLSNKNNNTAKRFNKNSFLDTNKSGGKATDF